jgi:hypothetical protein
MDTYVTAQDDDKDFLPAEHDGKAVQLRVSGEGSAAELSLHIRDGRGIGQGVSRGISCDRAVPNLCDGGKATPIDIMVDLASFLTVIEHFGSPDVCFSVSRNDVRFTPYLLIEDHDQEGAWHARTFLELIRHRGKSLPPPRTPKRRRGFGRGV